MNSDFCQQEAVTLTKRFWQALFVLDTLYFSHTLHLFQKKLQRKLYVSELHDRAFFYCS